MAVSDNHRSAAGHLASQQRLQQQRIRREAMQPPKPIGRAFYSTAAARRCQPPPLVIPIACSPFVIAVAIVFLTLSSFHFVKSKAAPDGNIELDAIVYQLGDPLHLTV